MPATITEEDVQGVVGDLPGIAKEFVLGGIRPAAVRLVVGVVLRARERENAAGAAALRFLAEQHDRAGA